MWPREERWGHASWSWFLREGGPNPPPPTHTPVKLLPLLFGGPTRDPGFSGLHRTLQVLPEGVLGSHGWDSGQPAGRQSDRLWQVGSRAPCILAAPWKGGAAPF